MLALGTVPVCMVDQYPNLVIADEADQKSLKGSGLFTNLPRVKDGKVHRILDSEGPAVGAAMSQATLASMSYAIDELVKAAKSA